VKHLLIPIHGRAGVVAEAVIDAESAGLVEGYRWNLSGGYARSRSRGSGTTHMSRLILGLEKGDSREADHLNGDRLDNRRCNLRITDHKGNAENRIPLPRTLAGMPGWVRAQWATQRQREFGAPPEVPHLAPPARTRTQT
jgi:hypothetical protein